MLSDALANHIPELRKLSYHMWLIWETFTAHSVLAHPTWHIPWLLTLTGSRSEHEK